MNDSRKYIRAARFVLALVTALFLFRAFAASAQTSAEENRYLLIFDTSSTMKKNLPATQGAVNNLLLSLMHGQLQAGDTIGVWTFASEVGAGRFPLQQWKPENAGDIASNIMAFVEKQRYRKTTDFEATTLMLSDVVLNSDRLTVLIFCDGDGEIHHAGFDDAINAAFEKNRKQMQKDHQPFIIVLRSQAGVYVGYTVNSPQRVDFPEFPPRPVPIAAPPPIAPTNPPPETAPAQPKIIAPPLIIVGTHVGTNLPPEEPPKLVETNSPPPEVAPTNPPPKIETNPPPVVEKTEPTNPVPAIAPTTPPPPPQKSGNDSKALKIGVALFAVAIVLVILLIRRGGKSGESLITRSMDKK
ncbi:MAG TPA: hypothetical protein VHG89_03510 [Verrucomicrobiae bacterium]|nr:hypothetical protein [Verrucomicrobiae bacterium]